MPFAAHGLGFLASHFASRWMRVRNGRMSYARSCAPNGESNCLFKGLVRTPGFLHAAMAWHVAFIVD